MDAGLFQGLKELRERNWQDLPLQAAEIDAVVLTHAHLDHCGYLPRLVVAGISRPGRSARRDAGPLPIVLPDAGRLQEEDAAFANRHGYSKHAPALPLYTEIDAFRAVSQLQPCGYDRTIPVAPGIDIEFINAGHLLGSSYVRMRLDGQDDPLWRRPRPLRPAGPAGPHDDRRTPTICSSSRRTAIAYTSRTTTATWLAAIVRDGRARRKADHPVVCDRPGRGADLLAERLEAEQRIPVLPVFVDSPMAAAALARYTERVARARSGAAAGEARRQGAARRRGAARAIAVRGGKRGRSARCASSARSGSA